MSAGGIAAMCVAVSAVMLVVVPVVGAVAGATGEMGRIGGLWPAGLIGSTLLWSGVIGAGAGVLGTALAWGLRSRGWLLLALVMLSIVTPGYLAFSALNMLRDPTTWTGDLLARAATGPDRWFVVSVGRGLAALGLVLWAWPIAAACAWAGVSRVGRGVEEQFLLDCPTRRARLGALARMLVRPLAAAVGFVWLLMLGSAVPLHIAEAPTLAMVTWTELALRPGGRRAWAVSAPLVALAVIGGVLLSRGAMKSEGLDDTTPAAVAGGRWAGALVLIVSAAVCLVPLAAHCMALEGPGSLARMWVAAGPPAAASAGVGVIVGMAGMVLVVGVWRGLSTIDAGCARARWSRALVHSAAVVYFVGMLLPGVLVGAAHARAWRWLDELFGGPGVSEGLLPMVAAHLARFGGVGVVIGVWLARTEDPATEDLARLDGAGGVSGWWRLVLWPRAGAVLGAGVIIGVLSLHEIESAVVLQPPGHASLAHLLLGYLHFTRREELSAAAVLLALGGLVLAGAVSLLLRSAARLGRRM
jgi:ABC-type spermidine/putrescine transport system permease subunit II